MSREIPGDLVELAGVFAQKYVIIDLDTPWIVDPAKLRSSCKNTPLDEAKFTGGAVRTIASGRTVFQRAMP